LLKLDRQFKSIVVGNPKVADVLVEDPRTILINAKTPDAKEKETNGNRTNMILLDNANEPIYSVEIVVHNPQTSELVPSLANVRVYPGPGNSAGSGGSAAKGPQQLADYTPYNCNTRDCARLQAEYQKELSKDIFTTGVRYLDTKGSTDVNSSPMTTTTPNAPGS
jgi:hypothetical protein